jgi:transcriptional regulator with XRE-family HTH domain
MHGSSPVTHEDEASAAITLLPPERLAVLLRARRDEAGVGVRSAARAAGIKIGALKDIEAGRRPAEIGVLAALLRCYRVPLGEFVPPRRPLVLTDPDGTPEEILRGYVDLVHKWRSATRKEKLNFRREDVLTLGKLLGTDPDEIERRLIAITGCSRAEARLLRKWFLAALITMPLAYGVLGGAIPAAAAALVNGQPAHTGAAATSQLAVTVDHSTGVMLPGSGSSHLSYTITNPNDSAASVAHTSARVHSDGGNITEHGAPVPGCEAAWFHATTSPPADAVQGQASVHGSVEVTMDNVNANQDACQGATPDITVDAG